MSYMNNKEPILKKLNSRRMKSGYYDFNCYTTIQDYQNAFNKFKNENGRFPTVIDMNKSQYLPTSKTIQRKFGSIAVLREMIGLEGLNLDMRNGEQRVSLITQQYNQGFKVSDILYEEALKYYKEEQLPRYQPYLDKKKNISRSDFGVYDGDRHFYVDSFVPGHIESFLNSIIAKGKKFRKYGVEEEIYLVIGNMEMNEAWFERKEMEAYRARDVIKKLPKNIKVITFEKYLQLVANKFNN
jgi:hypothetical protein